MVYAPPEFKKSAFNCPYCDAFARMHWERLVYFFYGKRVSSDMHISYCEHCHHLSYWLVRAQTEESVSGDDPTITGKMVVPSVGQVPYPHVDMPEKVKLIYEEAREVASASPRAAAALLRLTVQQLCIELGENGKNINDDIANLVKNGLPSEIQKALDIVRVVGNNAVHPRELQPDDITEIALSLFELANQIVEETITKPKKLEAIFDRLPKGARDAIEKRDR
jgi:hypothetical protein